MISVYLLLDYSLLRQKGEITMLIGVSFSNEG